MFRWYRGAAICYAYLDDVAGANKLDKSRWFTRGWTLQELIAPRLMRFYAADWSDLGSKLDLQNQLEEITGIDRIILSTGNFDSICVAKRMSWAAKRQTTRMEDVAYSLLGIFNVNMPLLYGEGKRSFIRLQEEIIKTSDDQTLFAWGLPQNFEHFLNWDCKNPMSNTKQLRGMLAESPSEFITTHDVAPLSDIQSDMPPIIFSNGLRIELPTYTRGDHKIAVISCFIRGRNFEYLGVPLFHWENRFTARCGPLILIPAIHDKHGPVKRVETLLIKAPVSICESLLQPISYTIVRDPKEEYDYFGLDEVYCLDGAKYSRTTRQITFQADQKGPHAVLFFNPSADLETALKRDSEFNVDYYVLKKRGILPFALVLGCDDVYWASFVPILREDNADKDFHGLLHYQKDLVRYCVTKSQLKARLRDSNDPKAFLRKKSHHIDQNILSYTQTTYSGRSSLTKFGYFNLCAKLQMGLANFVDRAVVVCIHITPQGSDLVKENMDTHVKMKSKITKDHEHPLHADFTPNWKEVGELRFFPAGED